MTILQVDAPKGPNLFARNCLYLIKCSSLISLVFTEVYTVCPKVFTEAHTVPTPQPYNSNINYPVCVSENYLFWKTKFDLSLQFAVFWTLFPLFPIIAQSQSFFFWRNYSKYGFLVFSFSPHNHKPSIWYYETFRAGRRENVRNITWEALGSSWAFLSVSFENFKTHKYVC